MSRCRPTIALVVCTALASCVVPQGDDTVLYQITPDRGLRHLDVEVAFDGRRPRALRAGDEFAQESVSDLRALPSGERLELDDDIVDLWTLGVGERVAYRIDLPADEREPRGGLETPESALRRRGLGVTGSPLSILLRPAGARGDPPLAIRFALPDGMSVSAPWPRDGASFSSRDTELDFRSQVALGFYDHWPLEVGDARLAVTVVGGATHASRDGLEVWLRRAVECVSELYGEFPVPRAQVLIELIDSDDRVSYGMTLRGGGAAIVIHKGNFMRDYDLGRDWVAVHEMLHLGMPAVAREDAWLSEGFTTYFQEVARARSGLQIREEAWRRLAGNLSAAAGRSANGTLREASRRMESDERPGSAEVHRVYWGGAAVALLLDVELRRRGGPALDEALREIHRRFRTETGTVSAETILEHLDAWYGEPLFTELTARHLDGRAFPPALAALDRLGVARDTGALRDDAPESDLRAAIMTRPDGGTR